MNLYRYTPKHRDVSDEQVTILVPRRTLAQSYRTMRASGLSPYMARLAQLGLWCKGTNE